MGSEDVVGNGARRPGAEVLGRCFVHGHGQVAAVAIELGLGRLITACIILRMRRMNYVHHITSSHLAAGRCLHRELGVVERRERAARGGGG